ncbi:MAG TPA: hypothetical protein VFH66_14005 [Mycobacteriales bacterium]|nr:hypothetical protein [Mycobacteriales bacterium]
MVMLAALAGSASAEPTKQFPVQVSCDGVPVQYVSPMLGADAIWLVGTDGELQRYAIVYADDYLGDRLLGAHTYGVKAGYGEPLTCTHRADWPGLGTVTGTIILAPAPSGG